MSLTFLVYRINKVLPTNICSGKFVLSCVLLSYFILFNLNRDYINLIQVVPRIHLCIEKCLIGYFIENAFKRIESQESH